MGAGTSTFHQFEAEELAQYAEKHLKENGEVVAALIRSNEIDGDLALSLREMGDDALVEFARDSEEDQAKLKRALEELDESIQEDETHEHHGPNKDEETRLVKQARMQALKYKRKHPNELHIHLIKARNLLVMDEAMIMGKGSSDPYVKFSCFGEKKKSQVKKKSLDPEWDEQIVLDIDDPQQFVEIEVWDYDVVSADDFMGRIVLPLAPYADKQRHRAWFPLLNKEGKVDKDKKTGKDKPRGEVELALTWAYSPERAKRVEMDLTSELLEERKFERKALAEAEVQRAKEHEEHKEARRKALVLSRQKQKYEDAKRMFYERLEQEKNDGDGGEGNYRDSDSDEEEDAIRGINASKVEHGDATSIDVHQASADETREERRARWDALVNRATEDVAEEVYETMMDDETNWENVAPEGAVPEFAPPSFESWWKHNKDTFDIPDEKKHMLPIPFEDWNAWETAKFVFPAFDDWVNMNDDTSLGDEASLLTSLEDESKHADESKEGGGGEEEKKDEEVESDGDSDGEDEDAKAAQLLAPNELCIALVRARGLQAVDFSLVGEASSDPMVTFECDGEIAKSSCKKRDLNPIWRERFTLPLHSFSDGASLVATVDDVDQIGANDFMGQTIKIDTSTLTKEWSGPSWYVLGDKDHSHDTLDDIVDKTGGKDDGSTKRAKLWLTILGAKDILAADKNGYSDPYAIAELVDKESGKPLKVPRTTKTKTIKKTLNPEWDDGEVQWSDITEDVETVTLLVKIFDADMLSSEALGCASIPLADLVTDKSSIEEAAFPLTSFGNMKMAATGEVRLLARVVVAEIASAAAKKLEAAAKAKATIAASEQKETDKGDTSYDAKLTKGGDEADREAAQQEHHEAHSDHAQLHARGAIEMALRVRHNPALVEPPLVPELVVPTIDNGMAQGIDNLEPEPLEYTDKAPNELIVTLWRGRNLRIMDANWFSKGGSSDPFVKFIIGQESCRSTTKKKDLNPVWAGESWSLKADSPDGVLTVIMEDYDALSGNDFMGKVMIPLRKLADRKPVRHWYRMTDKKGKRTGKPRGDIDLQLRWVHNPEYVEREVELTPDEALKPAKGELRQHRHLPRNELLVTVIRAKNLAIMDKNLFSSGGSSDPIVTLNIKGGGFPEGNGEGSWLGNLVSNKYRHVTKCISTVKKKNLAPIWKETFVLSCGNEDGQKVRVEGEKPSHSSKHDNVHTSGSAFSVADDNGRGGSKTVVGSETHNKKHGHHLHQRKNKKYHYRRNLFPEHAALDVVIDDYDLVGANDFMGRVRIPLKMVASGAPHRAWYTLGDKKTGRPDGITQRGQIELVLRWRHNPDTPEAIEQRRLAEEEARRRAEEAARDPIVVERKALDDLYNATGGQHWTHGHEWHSQSTPVGERFGVTTDEEGRVLEIELPRNNLHGHLPASIGKLKRLRLLSLPDNDISGPIPSEIGGLSRLIVVSLRGNRLSDDIPEEIGELTRLTCLALSDNYLTGSFPRSLFNLKRLVELRLFNNRLSGKLPDDPELWGSLMQLKYIGLTGNQFEGPIPGHGFRALRLRLNYLDLSDNCFSGTIPPELGDCLHLSYLSLAHNKLTGKIPGDLAHLTRLQYVDLSNNQLDVPKELPDDALHISTNPGILYDQIRRLFDLLGLEP